MATLLEGLACSGSANTRRPSVGHLSIEIEVDHRLFPLKSWISDPVERLRGGGKQDDSLVKG